MTCRDCGRVSEGRLCRECERDRRWEDRFDEAFGADDDDDDAGAAPVATDGGHSASGGDRDNLSQYTVAPQHGSDLAELEPYIIEGVAYSPLKMTFKSSSHDETLELRCDSCEWTTTVGELPQDLGYVQPDMCPDCAKEGELGFVRCQSPADGSLPSGWSDSNGRSVDTGSDREPRTDGGRVSARTLFDTITETIREHDNGNGAPLGTVVEAAIEGHDVDLQGTADAVAQLEAWGDIYRPDATTLRVTTTDGGEAVDYEAAGFVVASTYRADVMRELADGPATPTGIAEATGHKIPHISRALGNLREKGLVELLVPEETHKGRIYGLTERGEAVLSAVNQVVGHDAGGDGP